MNCLCNLTNTIPQCVEAIRIGTVTPSTDVIVIIDEIINGRSQRIETTSNLSGVVEIDTEDIMPFFSPNLLYSLRIVDATEQPIQFTIDSEALDCVQLIFSTGESGLAILTLAA